MSWLKAEPVLIMGAVQAALALSLAFGAPLSTVQVSTILAFTAALLGLITRQMVTPNVNVPAPVLPGKRSPGETLRGS